MILQKEMQEELYFNNKCHGKLVFVINSMDFDFYETLKDLYHFMILIKYVQGHSFKFGLGQYKHETGTECRTVIPYQIKIFSNIWLSTFHIDISSLITFHNFLLFNVKK